MFIYRILSGLILIYMPISFAFDCYITAVKDSCWTDYNVSVTVLDASNNKNLHSITIPKGQSWAREQFTCEPGQNLNFQSSFNPVFWAQDQGVIYPAIQYKLLPKTLDPGKTAWNLTICYSSDFSGVPVNPQARSFGCKCDLKSIPELTVS